MYTANEATSRRRPPKNILRLNSDHGISIKIRKAPFAIDGKKSFMVLLTKLWNNLFMVLKYEICFTAFGIIGNSFRLSWGGLTR